MTSLEQVEADFDRIAGLPTRRWSSNKHYYKHLLRQIPDGCERILDVGCGKGDFCKELALKCGEVYGIDLSSNMITIATENKSTENVSYCREDYLKMQFQEGHFDCIISIATVHHFSLSQFLNKSKRELKKGGKLIILDLYQPETLVDALYSIIATMLSSLYQLYYNGRFRGSYIERRVWTSHGKHDKYPTIKSLHSTFKTHLKGYKFRRKLFWRYCVTWQNTHYL